MAREMKDSGIEWIGEIPKSWKLLKGKYLFRLRNEKGNIIELQLLSPTQKYGVIPQEMYEELSGMTAVKLDDNTDLSTLKSIYEGDFCISLRSFQGGFEYSKYNGVVSPAYQVFYKTADLCDTYYRYMFKDCGFIAKMTSYTKTFRDGKSISFTDFGNSLIPVPPLDEQERIACFLDTECGRIDAVIEQTRASIEEYKKLKQAVITQAVTKGIRPNRPMKDSGIDIYGVIPKSWDCCKLKYLISSLNSGTSVLATDLIEDGYPVFGGGQQIGCYSHFNMENTLVIGRVGARCGCVTKVEGKAWATDNALIVSTAFPTNYLYYILVAAELNKLNTSNAQPLITSGKVLNHKVPICWDKVEQYEITAYLDEKTFEIDKLIEKKEQFISELEKHKKSLTYEYVTGKKDVPA